MTTVDKSLEEELEKTFPKLYLAQWVFKLSKLPENHASTASIKRDLMADITKYSMAPYYKYVCDELHWTIDPQVLATLESSMNAKLQEVDKAVADAKENTGESEIHDAAVKRFKFYLQVGDRKMSEVALKDAMDASKAKTQQLNLLFDKLRMYLFWGDRKIQKETIDKILSMFNDSTEWDKKNRLKVYEALYNMSTRDFTKAASNLVSSIATFSAFELITFQEFVAYTVLVGCLALPRTEIKEKIIDSPEILLVSEKMPVLGQLASSLYSCNYSLYFRCLSGVCDEMMLDKYLHEHASYYLREMRLRAYTQVLESYRSVSLASMAAQFGMSESLLESDLVEFISNGRLACQIDGVSRVVQATKLDDKTSHYQTLLTQGDNILNRVQQLSTLMNI